jgi:hypothetical protein
MPVVEAARVLCVSALAVGLVLLPPGPQAHAELVATADAVAAASGAGAARDRLAGWLARDDVARELERLGIAPEEARRRVSALSDGEAAALAERIDQAPAGAGFGSVVLVVAIVVAFFVLTDALGVTDVFPWVSDVRN